MKNLLNHRRVSSKRSDCKGFTLLEVIMSLAIIALGVIPVMSLLTVGLDTLNSVIKKSVMTEIEQEVRTSLEKSTSASLSTLATQAPQTLFFDLQGLQLPSSVGSIYTVTVSAPQAPSGGIFAGQSTWCQAAQVYEVVVTVSYQPGGTGTANLTTQTPMLLTPCD